MKGIPGGVTVEEKDAGEMKDSENTSPVVSERDAYRNHLHDYHRARVQAKEGKENL